MDWSPPRLGPGNTSLPHDGQAHHRPTQMDTPPPTVSRSWPPPPSIAFGSFLSQIRNMNPLQQGQHPCKRPLLRLILQKQASKNGTGLQRISDLLRKVMPDSTQLEDTSEVTRELLPAPHIENCTKVEVADRHKEWLKGLEAGTITPRHIASTCLSSINLRHAKPMVN